MGRKQRQRSVPTSVTVNQEDFDISSFCSGDHMPLQSCALPAEHPTGGSITSSSSRPRLEGLNLAPGNLIRVQSEASLTKTRNGVIDETGLMKTPSPLDDAVSTRNFVYRPGSDKVEEIKMQGKVNRR